MIAIFPGHLGEGPGAVDDKDGDGFYTVESAIAGMVSVRTKFLLETLGFKSEMFIGSLESRVEESSASEITCGLSIHCDSLVCSPDTRGMHTLIYPGSKGGRALSGEIIRLWEKMIVSIPSKRSSASEMGNLYILRKTKFPVVLVELGFLSNVEDEEALNQDSVLEDISRVLALATINYLTKEHIWEITQR